MSTPTGQGGSMARFALGPNHLYVVDTYNVKVYEINDSGSLVEKTIVQAGFGIETIFIRGEDLFLGANDAMYRYSITDPEIPKFVSRYDHIISCDPVVVNGNYAYVTLRIDVSCRAAGQDALEIIDISNPSSPQLVKSYAVTTPYGLGIDGNTLFLCEGNNGLKIFDVTNPTSISLIKHYPSINSYDVIPRWGTLIMTGADGIFQYDYTDLSDVRLLSHIAVD
jgi:hypothetical protein